MLKQALTAMGMSLILLGSSGLLLAQTVDTGATVNGSALDATKATTSGGGQKITAVVARTVEIPPASDPGLGADVVQPPPAPPAEVPPSVEIAVDVNPVTVVEPAPVQAGEPAPADPTAAAEPAAKNADPGAAAKTQAPPPPPPPQVRIEAAERRPDFLYRQGRREFRSQNTFSTAQINLAVGPGVSSGAVRYVPIGEF